MSRMFTKEETARGNDTRWFKYVDRVYRAKDLKRLGWKTKDIAVELGVHVGTARRYIHDGVCQFGLTNREFG